MSPLLTLAIWGLLAIGLGAAILTTSYLFGPRRKKDRKFDPYECGVPMVQSDARERINVHFYVIAILFILFDIETIFLIPWAVIYRELGIFGVVEMGVFVGVLILGFFYCWKRGALDFKRPEHEARGSGKEQA